MTPTKRRGPKLKDPKEIIKPVTIWVKQKYVNKAQLACNKIEKQYR